MKVQCQQCKTTIECNPQGKCWCKNFPYKIKQSNIDAKKRGCLCEVCLSKQI